MSRRRLASSNRYLQLRPDKTLAENANLPNVKRLLAASRERDYSVMMTYLQEEASKPGMRIIARPISAWQRSTSNRVRISGTGVGRKRGRRGRSVCDLLRPLGPQVARLGPGAKSFFLDGLLDGKWAGLKALE